MRYIKRTAAAVMALMLLASCGKTSEERPPAEISTDTAVVSEQRDSEYVYCLCSVSKIYVTAAIMQLADEGKLDIENPVTEYIPDFKMADKRYKDITVHMLMDHTSGIMGSTTKNGGLYEDNDMYAHDHLLEALSSQRLKADPGKYAAYCNDGFDLLEMIVENVSGLTYTDYIRENISCRTGAEMTGTAVDMMGHEALVPNVRADNMRLDTAYSMVMGTGGVYAAASDNANFGAAFFTGSDTLISEGAKAAMAERHNDNEYSDDNGLGWDFAGLPRYQQHGVNAVGKGGDSSSDHSFLLIAPDEHISVSVLSKGGSCIYNDLVAQSLMDAALEEKGISIADIPPEECTVLTQIPEEYNKYAGWYIVNTLGQGDKIYNVSFPENKYMHIEESDHARTVCSDHLLTSEGDFVQLAYEVEGEDFDTQLAAGYSRLSFEENSDGTYLKLQSSMELTGLGIYDIKTYCGQKAEENDVSDDVMNSFKELEGKMLLLCSDKYSSSNYDAGIIRLYVSDKLSGYVFADEGGRDSILKMTDKDHLTAFKDIPSSGSRDMWDMTIERDDKGISSVKLSCGLELIPDDRASVFDADVRSVQIKENAQWYNISDSIANTPVTVKRPENGVIYVYNKFGEVIYSTHNKDARPQIPMPKGGKVLFLGQSGDRFDISM